MSQIKSIRIGLCFALAMIAALSLVNDANAQQRPRSTMDRKTNYGKGFWENQSASRSIQHARDYSSDLYRYTRDVPAIQPPAVQWQSQNLGTNIARAQTDLAVVGQQYVGDAEVQQSLGVVNSHLATAAEIQGQLHEECQKASPDGSMSMQCCSKITTELDKAAAEHAGLQRTLEQRAIVNPPQPRAKQ